MCFLKDENSSLLLEREKIKDHYHRKYCNGYQSERQMGI